MASKYLSNKSVNTRVHRLNHRYHVEPLVFGEEKHRMEECVMRSNGEEWFP